MTAPKATALVTPAENRRIVAGLHLIAHLELNLVNFLVV